ncbi:HD domain-containing protein [Neiella sp. HB171785]|uniref:HD domain-containing protein n=1 Tax=Neiella litorisoli TaxID=2771431 RepID=A0A8J6QU91_9GAMM|nr:YfbR-like 5'-deoxynucleotidase [Neiella litorisoli]MBD1389557.1 HD domain-containing protein [Neiella litorisoli]
MSGFLSLALRQRHIKRWALMDCVHDESVLEHSAMVAILTVLVGQIARKQGKDLDITTMVAHAVLHDVPEVICQDLIAPIKNANPGIKREYGKLETEACHTVLTTLPVAMQEQVAFWFAPGGMEQELVKACDKYATLIKSEQEVAAGNQFEFADALAKTRQLVEELCVQYPEIAELHQLLHRTERCELDFGTQQSLEHCATSLLAALLGSLVWQGMQLDAVASYLVYVATSQVIADEIDCEADPTTACFSKAILLYADHVLCAKNATSYRGTQQATNQKLKARVLGYRELPHGQSLSTLALIFSDSIGLTVDQVLKQPVNTSLEAVS